MSEISIRWEYRPIGEFPRGQQLEDSLGRCLTVTRMCRPAQLRGKWCLPELVTGTSDAANKFGNPRPSEAL